MLSVNDIPGIESYFIHVIVLAVRYADKMQKEITNKRSEVDNLQSKLRKLDDKVDLLIKVGYHLSKYITNI